MLVLGGITEDLNVAVPTDSTVVLTNTPIWNRRNINPLGDINGDGFDDIAFSSSVLFGRADIGQESSLSVGNAEDSATSRFWLEVDERRWSSQIYAVGDINGDGINDVLLRNHYRIVFGGADLGAEREILVNDLPKQQSLVVECTVASPECYGIHDAAAVGDLNGDGFEDAAIGLTRFGTLVVFGGTTLPSEPLVADRPGSAGFIIPTAQSPLDVVHLGFNVYSEYGPDNVRYSGAGDFDGDGFDDMLVAITGNDCPGRCTGTHRDSLESTGGAVIVFGSAEIGDGGTFEETSEATRQFRITVHYFDRRPQTEIADVNHDGRPDVVLGTEGVSYAVLDVEGMSDIDFGWGGAIDPTPSRELNGENGFGQFGDRAFVDLNHDGLVDQVVFEDPRAPDVYLGQSAERERLVGEGDIEQLIDIDANASVVFTVRGRLRDESAPISSTAISMDRGRPEDLRDNIASSLEGVLVDVGLSSPLVGPDRESEFDVTLTNAGPTNATGVTIDEDITDALTGVEWTRREMVFPKFLDLQELNGSDGASFGGPPRAYQYRSTPSAGYETPLFKNLGMRVGSLGDVNGDGFDDIYAVGQIVLSLDAPQVMSIYGGSKLDAELSFPDDFSVVDSPPDAPEEISGDINGDGFLDRITGDNTVRRERGETYVTFGTASGIPDIAASDLDGTNGFVIRGENPGDLTGFSVAAGDVNNDGFDDVIIGEGSSDEPDVAAERDSRIHVVYGRGAWLATTYLKSIDGYNGFWMETGSGEGRVGLRGATVASNFDVNGDGIDDILIGDTAGGVPVDYFANHGAVYVVFGRQQTSASGTGSISDVIDVPLGGEVTYSVRGVLPEGAELPAGTVTAAVSAAQIDLDPPTNTATLGEVRLLSDLDSDGTVGFSDYLVLASNFGESDASREQGDLNGDGTVDLSDFVVLASQFGGSFASRL